MRLQTFIVEGKTPKKLAIFDEIKKNCQPYIKLIKTQNHCLVRHSNSLDYSQIYKFETRKNRKPLDMPQELHQIIDNSLFKKFGWKPRSEGLFCNSTGTRKNYLSYYFVIFPIGDFSFVWSPNVEDLVPYLSDQMYEKVPGMEEIHDWPDFKKVLPEVERILAGKKNLVYWKTHGVLKEVINTYTDKDPKAALKSGSEISVKCDGYYMVGGSRYYKDIAGLFGKAEQ